MSGELSRVKIKGFRSIKECDLRLGKINVLIGSNGSGKSNFISVFGILRVILWKNLQFSAAQIGISSLFFNGRKVTDEIEAEFFFDNNSYGFVLVPTDDNRLIFKKEFFGYSGSNDTQSKIPSDGHEESKWEIGTGNNIANYVIPILKKLQWRVYHFHDTGRSSNVKQEHNLSDNSSLKLDAANLAAFLYRLRESYPENYERIVKTVQLVAPYFGDFVLTPNEVNNEKIILKWRQFGCEDIFNASQLSDGTLRFICLAVSLLQPPELQPQTIIIDEPELGLHPYSITIFAEMVKQVSNNKQIILSTQSVELLNEFEAEHIIVVDRQNGESLFRRLDVEQLEEWLEDYTLGELWKKNIFGGRVSE